LKERNNNNFESELKILRQTIAVKDAEIKHLSSKNIDKDRVIEETKYTLAFNKESTKNQREKCENLEQEIEKLQEKLELNRAMGELRISGLRKELKESKRKLISGAFRSNSRQGSGDERIKRLNFD